MPKGVKEGKLSVFNLGEKGVNVVRSPIHLTDGELTQAQNAQFDQTGQEGGIRKRDGMAKVNAAALGAGASISGIMPVPLTDFSELTKAIILVAEDAGVSYWDAVASDLADILSAAAPDWPAGRQYADLPFAVQRGQGHSLRFATWADRFFYVDRNGILYSAQGAYTANGSYEKLFTVQNPTGYTGSTFINDLLLANGRLYFATIDGQSGGNWGGRVFMMNPATGVASQVGGQFGSNIVPQSLTYWNGYLWLGTTAHLGTGQGRVYRIRPDIDSAWSAAVYTAPANNAICTGLAGYKGNMYATFCGLAATTAAIVVQITPALATSVVDTAATLGGYFGQPAVYNGVLYCPWGGVPGSASLVRSYNGTAWATAYTDPTYTGANPGCPLAVSRFGRLVIPWGLGTNAVVLLFTGAAWTLLTASSLTEHIQGNCAYVED